MIEKGWIESRLKLFDNHKGGVIFNATQAYGINHLIKHQNHSNQSLVWLELSHKELDDLSLGNALAEAVNKALGMAFLPFALPYSYGLSLIQSQMHVLQPIAFALCRADLHPAFSQAFLDLSNSGAPVFAQFDEIPKSFSVVANYLVISKEQVQLSPDEALSLNENHLSYNDLSQLLKDTDYAVDAFLAEWRYRQDFSPYLRPNPNGLQALEGYAVEPQPQKLLLLLEKKERWQEAFELALDLESERALEFLALAAPGYHEQGLHKKLFYLLKPHLEDYRHDEIFLFWLLQAAFRMGQENDYRQLVENYLARHDAPDLRALYSGVLSPWAQAEEEAKKAYELKPSAYTAFQLGRRTDNSHEAINILKHSVDLAERYGSTYELVRNSAALANKYMQQGRFHSAASLFKWALDRYDEANIKDGQRQLRITNDWAFTRILQGDLQGLEELLINYEKLLSNAHPDLARLFRSTLGDYYLTVEQIEKARDYYTINFETQKDLHQGQNVLELVRTYIELGQIDEAIKLAKTGLGLSRGLSLIYEAPALLAYGIALCFSQPQKAIDYLYRARKAYQDLYIVYRLDQVELYLCYAHTQLEEHNKAQAILADSKHLKQLSLSCLRFLSGPEYAFKNIWSSIQVKKMPLELRFLGKNEVWYQGEKLELFPQWYEILAILAIKQRPITLEELMLFLKGEKASRNTIKASVAKLRKLIPISAHPYKIDVPFEADFLNILRHIEAGNLQDALQLFQGSLLVKSSVPLIREHDQFITESLKKATLQIQDIDILMGLSEYLQDDLQLLEASHRLLEKSDPRASIIQTRLNQLRNHLAA